MVYFINTSMLYFHKTTENHLNTFTHTNKFMYTEVKWKSLNCVPVFVTPWTIQSMEFSRPEYWSGKPFPFLGDLNNLEIEPRSPSLQAGFFFYHLIPGNPKNTGVGSLALQQWYFLTQELNLCLLHCRWILYQLSYQGNPMYTDKYFFSITINTLSRIIVGMTDFCI